MARLLLLVALMNLVEGNAHGGGGPEPGFLRLHAETRGFTLGRPSHPVPTPDGRSVLFLRSAPRQPVMSLWEFDVASGKTRELLTPEKLLKGAEEKLSAEERARRERMRITTRGFTGFELSRDGALLLLTLSGRLYTVRRADGAVSELSTGASPILDPRLSPDGGRIAFVRDRDLYVLDLASGRERRLTTSTDPAISHGLAEFVAQEEMERFRGYWWSPDGSALAFEEADDRGVEVLTISDPARPEAAADRARYPRPGKANTVVRLGVVRADGHDPAPAWVRWDAARFPYLASVVWAKGGPLTLVVMTREQQDLEVLAADPKGGPTRRLLAEHDPAWLDLDQSTPRWLPDGSGFLWSSDRDGTRRLELHDANGRLQRVLTPPTPPTLIDLAYIKLLHVDPAEHEVYFVATSDPTEQHVWRVPLSGGRAERLTADAGVHGGEFAEAGDAPRSPSPSDASKGAGAGPTWVETAMTERVVMRAVVHAGGRAAGELPSVAVEPPFRPNVEYTEAGPDALRALLVRPRVFDSRRRYPVWLDVYGGPHHQQVTRALQPSLFRQWIADHGYVVVSIDGRGTPHRGRAFERAIRGDFGQVPLDDQVAALRALGARHPELDLSRVGVVGWSFGGYLAALSVLRRPDVFQVGVAGAPVVDWRDYDTCYTERYLGLPEANPAGYRQSSLLTYAAGLARPLLVVHGTSDDNVYFFHSLKLADALMRAGKQFEFLPLPGFTHLVPDPVVREQMWNRILAVMAGALHP